MAWTAYQENSGQWQFFGGKQVPLFVGPMLSDGKTPALVADENGKVLCDRRGRGTIVHGFKSREEAEAWARKRDGVKRFHRELSH
jgi:hypothetical protein